MIFIDTPSRTVSGISTATDNKTSFLDHSTRSSTYNVVITSSSSSTFYGTRKSIETSIKPLSTTLSTISIGTQSRSTTVTMISTPVSTSSGSTGSNTLLLAGAISSFSTLILLLVAIVLIVSVLVCKRRLNKTTNRYHAPQRKLNQGINDANINI